MIIQIKMKRRIYMATSKKNNYIDMELEWLETKAQEMRTFVDSKPLSRLKDRTVNVGTKTLLTANVEAQHKNIRDTLKDYALIIEAISRLRERDEVVKLQSRGDADLSPMEDGQI